MISLQDLVPNVYSNQSRDFQLLERLYDTVINSVKTNSDLIYNCPLNQNSDTRLMDLIALTLGFSSKHNYNIKQLTALCNAFIYVIKNKGSIKSIRAACNAVVSAEGLTQEVEIEISKDNTEITLYIPQGLSDINLLKDLLNYILPAGMSCSIVKELLVNKPTTTIIATTESITKYYKTEEQEATMIGINMLENISAQFKDTTNSGNIAGSIANNVIMQVNSKVMPEELSAQKGTRHLITISSRIHSGEKQTEAITIELLKQNWVITKDEDTLEFTKTFDKPIPDKDTLLYINHIEQPKLSESKYTISATEIKNKYKNNDILIATKFNTEVIKYKESSI